MTLYIPQHTQCTRDERFAQNETVLSVFPSRHKLSKITDLFRSARDKYVNK